MGELVLWYPSFYSGRCKDLGSRRGGSGSVFRQVCVRCVALYDASRKISVMPDGPRQIALLGCVSYGYCRVLMCCWVQ